MERLGEVDQVEDILLETRTTETDRRLEELGADTSILADGVSDLVDGGTSSLANSGQGVDRRDTLGKHGVGSKLGKLRRPETDGKDSLLGDPVGVDVRQSLASGKTRLGLKRTDEDTVRGEKVVDGGTLGKELCESALRSDLSL